MTEQAKLQAIKQLAERHITANTATLEAARASMVRKGIYTPSGRLTAQYGGEDLTPATTHR